MMWLVVGLGELQQVHLLSAMILLAPSKVDG